tara:strand:+ start:613 stop:768 length:156 start_codon:yes stop_codon:yes gene_type:complete
MSRCDICGCKSPCQCDLDAENNDRARDEIYDISEKLDKIIVLLEKLGGGKT